MVSRVRVSRVNIRVRVRVRVRFMVWVRGNVREGKCTGGNLRHSAAVHNDICVCRPSVLQVLAGLEWTWLKLHLLTSRRRRRRVTGSPHQH